MSIHLKIKELREAIKMKSKDFADSLGIDRSQYSKIESGKLTPTLNQLMEIKSIYKVSIDWLLTGSGEMLKADNTAKEASAEDERRAPPVDYSELARSQQRTIEVQAETIRSQQRMIAEMYAKGAGADTAP